MKLNSKSDVYLLMYSATPSAALAAAIETGLLWQLAAKPMSAAEIAQTLKIPGKRCHYWLQMLHELGILDAGPGGYAPSALAREAILDVNSRESRQYLTVEERERTAGLHDLPVLIGEPGSIWAAQGMAEPIDYVEKMRIGPAKAREFTRMLFEIHQSLATEIAERVDMTGVERMMDLGGGSGVVSMALLRKYPALTATVVDIENVCIAGREIAEEQGLSDRISYHPADFADGEFPDGFELALQCDVGVFGVPLFRKIWRALKQDGQLVMVGRFSPTEEHAPPGRVEWTFLSSLRDPNFSVPTLEQVRMQWVQAGFEESPEHHAFGSGWIMVQARKAGTSVGP